MPHDPVQTWSESDVAALEAPLNKLCALLWPWLLSRPVHQVAARKPGDGLDPWKLPRGERHRWAYIPGPGQVGLNVITTFDQLEDPDPVLHWSFVAFRVLSLPMGVEPSCGPCARDRDDVRCATLWTVPDAVVALVKRAVMPFGGPAHIYAVLGTHQIQFIGPSLPECRRAYAAWLGRDPSNN